MSLDTKSYDRYKLIKDKLSFKEDGIEFNHVLAFYILRFIYDKTSFSKKDIIGGFFKTLDVDAFVSDLQSDKPLFSDSVYRPDHYNLLQLVREGIDHNYYREQDTKRHFTVNIKNIISSFIFCRKALKGISSFDEMLCLCSGLVYYRNVAKALKNKVDPKKVACKKYIAFCNPFGIEALLTQFTQQFGITTFTLSHGLGYVNYKQTIPLDIVNAENITAKYVFVWGNSSKTDLHTNFGFPNERILIGGNPKYKHREINVKQSFKSCIVLLGRKAYDKSNLEILKIVSKLKQQLGIQVDVRLHISLSKSYYQGLCDEFNVNLANSDESLYEAFGNGKYDFALVNNSTTYYEAMYFNMLCFRYAGEENEIYTGLDDKFENTDDILLKMESFKNEDLTLLNKRVETLLVDSLGMGLNKYKETIMKTTTTFNEPVR